MRVVRTLWTCSLVSVVTASAISTSRQEASPAPQATQSCITAPGSVRGLGVEKLWSDRGASNRFALPWRDITPPAVVTNPVICRRAARAYLGDSTRVRPDSTLRAVVVEAGGLYFVKALPVQTAGEFELVAVLDPKFALVKYLTQ